MPRHSASSANSAANGSGSPWFSASAASRSRSITCAVSHGRSAAYDRCVGVDVVEIELAGGRPPGRGVST
jgi:hypothetical protein